VFPETVRFRRRCLREIGRAVIFGLEPNDHALRDVNRARRCSRAVDLALSAKGQRYLQNDARRALVVEARAYWFNDMDHGVLADTFFRYSVRVDGTFVPGSWSSFRRAWPAGHSAAARTLRRRLGVAIARAWPSFSAAPGTTPSLTATPAPADTVPFNPIPLSGSVGVRARATRRPDHALAPHARSAAGDAACRRSTVAHLWGAGARSAWQTSGLAAAAPAR
jgi:hypothetical protein